MRQVFWKIWANEYLHTLQQRYKWQTAQPQIQVGDVVLTKMPNSAPCIWPLGIVTKIFPGKEELIRQELCLAQPNILYRPEGTR